MKLNVFAEGRRIQDDHFLFQFRIGRKKTLPVFFPLRKQPIDPRQPAVDQLVLRLIEKLMDGSDSYDLVQTDALTMSAGTYNHPSKGTPFDERSKEYRGDAWEEKGER